MYFRVDYVYTFLRVKYLEVCHYICEIDAIVVVIVVIDGIVVVVVVVKASTDIGKA